MLTNGLKLVFANVYKQNGEAMPIELGKIKWVTTPGDTTKPILPIRQYTQGCEIILGGFAYTDMDSYVARWEVYCDGDVQHYFTDFSFELVKNGCKETNYMVIYTDTLVLEPITYNDACNKFKKAVLQGV